MEYRTCADILNDFMVKKDMTPKDLAELSERSIPTVSYWLRGIKSPSRTTRHRLFDKTHGELNLIA